MNEAAAELERQGTWQRERRLLSWPEKVKMVEAIRESIVELRRNRKRGPPPPGDGPTSPRKPFR